MPTKVQIIVHLSLEVLYAVRVAILVDTHSTIFQNASKYENVKITKKAQAIYQAKIDVIRRLNLRIIERRYADEGPNYCALTVLWCRYRML